MEIANQMTKTTKITKTKIKWIIIKWKSKKHHKESKSKAKRSTDSWFTNQHSGNQLNQCQNDFRSSTSKFDDDDDHSGGSISQGKQNKRFF